MRVALLLMLFVLAGSAPQRQALLAWWDRAGEQKVGYYWFKTDLPPEEARELARHMNLLYEEYSRRLASLPQRAPEKLNVLMFRSQRDYVNVLRQRYGLDGRGSGGVFFVTPAGAGLAFWTEGLPERRIHHVMQHEGFHQFAYSRFGFDLPIWVNEGLAEFFGESVMVGRKLVLGQSQQRVIENVRNAVELGEHIRFRDMLTMSDEQWKVALARGNAGLQYNQAWSMVHFLVYGDGGRYVSAFENYLKLMNRGVLSEQAFVQSFGADIDAFERKWIEYAQAARPSALVTAMERLEFLAEGMLVLATGDGHPASLDELKAELQKLGFTHSLSRHGVDVQLDAADGAMYEIPMDDLCREQPVIVVEPIEPNRLPLRLRRLEQFGPMPPIIRTENLEPRNLRIRWIRRGETSEFLYEVEVE